MFFACFRFFLLSLSTEIIVLILQFLPLQTVLTRVNRLCWKIHNIIENSPNLWKDIYFDYHICISCGDLRRLLIHSRKAQSIHLPHLTCEISSLDIDSVLTSSKFDSLIWLDLSQAPVSTLCFLYNAPNYFRSLQIIRYNNNMFVVWI